MIAVHADPSEHAVVAEFFELFKTPWKFHAAGEPADVLICSSVEIPANEAALVLIYTSREDPRSGGSVRSQTVLAYCGAKIPIYGNSQAFGASGETILRHESTGEPAMTSQTLNGRTIVRVGYDLFQEIRRLLTQGQPESNAAIPALERHIAVLRDLIVARSGPLLEIPPVPDGYNFIACLTHDVDHVGIKNHKFDHTLAGFLFRATLGSMRDVFRGRKTWRQLATNWVAVLKLPMVHLGLAADFWHPFDQYIELEGGAPSTFFVIPKKGEPGLDAAGNRPARRAASYDAAGLSATIKSLQAAGKEVGVHGLDAWRDTSAGRAESAIIARMTGKTECGVRMHWLYFDEHSPEVLERAGFSYDSTTGFNGTIGYRAGTAQVYRPPACAKLLELPMHIMDTALFYPAYLNLSPARAEEVIRPMLDHCVQSGGVLTVNWHDRSIVPERLWDGTYRHILEECRAHRAWFATASQTVAWFQKRRVAKFVAKGDGRVGIRVAGASDQLPGLRVRIVQPGQDQAEVVEHAVTGDMEVSLAACGRRKSTKGKI